MMKNVVFIPYIKRNQPLGESGVTKPRWDKGYEYGINSWKEWCKQNNCTLFIMDELMTSEDEMLNTWQRWNALDILDHNKIKYNQIAKVGNPSLLHKKRTLKNVIKRSISSGEFNPDDTSNLYPVPDDKEYKSWSIKNDPDVNAAIFFMSDISASMTDDKRDLIKELCWYLDNWIRKFYTETDINYIVHDWSAEEVDQEKFYSYTSGGGTQISSAFELVKDIIENRYPLDEWNIYIFYLSDGENWGTDNTKTADYIKILQKWCNVIGITEVKGNTKWAQFAKYIENRLTEGSLDLATVTTGKIDKHEDLLKQLRKMLLVGNGQWIDV